MRKEIKVLKTLNHTNIVHYFQADLSPDLKTVAILLEYIPGGSLKNILSKYGIFEIPVVRNYARQLLLGLKYLHDNKIVHRDLKPANVLISTNGVLKLTDFGSSKKFDDMENYLSRSLRGSPYWMAPEVVRMEGHSFSADIWSFGCILIEMVSGMPPWANYTDDGKSVMELISKDGMLPDIPETEPKLREVIVECVNRDPAARPSTQDLLENEFFLNL
jgi:mitogen-activated protein kinase kinase kinase